ncbi:DUF317 domain-containing protein [Streptomyces sp. NPDC058619]|uniref:DUF317 domain-containing protein n=1 Tax=unclassified Streptomyces TaxID=2593676 RepID=UPI003669C37B
MALLALGGPPPGPRHGAGGGVLSQRPFIYTRADEPHYGIWFETSPRHLAGRGDPRHITQALRAAGWSNHSDPDYPHVLLSSPDQRYALALEPENESYSKWWRISCTSDDENWYAQFGGNTPVEILAGFTDALLIPVPETAPDVWSILTAAGWTHVQDERGHELAEHPDGIMQLRRWNTPSNWNPGWTAAALLPDGLGGQESVWEAHLGNAQHLAAAFATALVDPRPVARAELDVPHSGLVTQKPGGRQADDLAKEHATRLARARTTAVHNRRTTLTTQPVTSPTPAAPVAAVHRR